VERRPGGAPPHNRVEAGTLSECREPTSPVDNSPLPVDNALHGPLEPVDNESAPHRIDDNLSR